MLKEKMLIVDDVKDIVNLVSDILEYEGYDVEKAYNGTLALQLIKKTIMI